MHIRNCVVADNSVHRSSMWNAVQVYDEEGVDRTPQQLVQRQMVPTQPPPQAALSSMLPGGKNTGGSILGRQHRESRMSSRVSKLSELCLPVMPSLAILQQIWECDASLPVPAHECSAAHHCCTI